MFAKEKMKSNEGFTLLEILVVLTIMGFLLAMVAPKFANIGDDAIGTVCDTNASRGITMLATYFNVTGGSFPGRLTNIVKQDGTGTTGFSIPEISDGDPGDGPEVLAADFASRNKFVIHHLNETEVEQLADMGVDLVLDLNDYTGMDTDPGNPQSSMREHTLEEGSGVAMIGVGASTAADNLDWFRDGTPLAVDERGWGDPTLIGRIILGMGPENGIITSGLVANAAHCPGGLDSDNFTYNDYNIVLPRLAGTVARWATTGTADAVEAVQHPIDEPLDSTGYGIADTTLKVRTFNFSNPDVAPQEAWEYTVLCPEGHMFPAGESEWGVDISGEGTIN